METILKQLYSGEISPIETYQPLMNEFREIRKKQYQHYKDFINDLEQSAPSLSQHFIEIMDEQIETLPLEFSNAFIDSFRLGAKIMIEVFGDTNGTVLDIDEKTIKKS